jgi:hypothetical protein
LSALLSDRQTELALAAAKADAAPKKSNGSTEPSSQSKPEPIPVIKAPGQGRSSHSWVGRLIFGAVGAFLLFAYLNNTKKPSYTPTYRPQPTSSYSLPSRAASPTPSPQPTPSYVERMPAVGRDLALDEPEIRYCLSQKIRIEGARSVVNDNDTSQYQIDRFNQLIEHYNSRCSSYRYKPSVMSRVRTDVESRRGSLFFEGQNLVR